MSGTHPSTPERAAFEGAVREAVLAALAEYPDAARWSRRTAASTSTTSEGWRSRPRTRRRHRPTVSYWGTDEVVLGFGETHMYFWDSDPARLREEARDVLEAVFAGRVVEAGRRGNSTSRLVTGDGRRMRVAELTLPFPWGWRRTRRYAPLGDRRWVPPYLSSLVTVSNLDALDEQYEQAEAQDRAAVRQDRPRGEAASLAEALAEAAAAYNAAAYERLHNSRTLLQTSA